MPPRFDMGKPIPTKQVKEVADKIIPEYIKSNEEQDLILKSVNELPEVISEQSLMLAMNQDIAKSLMVQQNAAAIGDKDPKSLLIDTFGVVSSIDAKQAYSGMSYQTLNNMASQCQPIAAIINTRLNQIASFGRVPRSRYGMGFRVEKLGGGKLSSFEKNRATKLEQFFINCGEGHAAYKRDYFEQFLKKLGRDRFRYDQVNFERVFTRGGKLHEMVAVDAASIRIALRKYLDDTDASKDITDSELEADRGPWGRGNHRINVPLEHKAYLQVLHGQMVTEYTEDEMAFLVSWPRTDLRNFGYGYSEVEQLIETVTAILYASEYNRRFFSSGSSPKGVLNVKGNMSMNSLDSFKKGWIAQLTGLSGSWRTPIVAAENGLEFINMQQTNREMEFSKYMDFLIKISCAVFQIAPEEINFSSQSGASGNGTVFESKGELKLKASRDKGLVPLLSSFENWMNREVMRYLDDDYEFVFVGLDGMTEADQLELDEKRLKTSWTIDEIREENGREPLKKYGDVIENPQYMAAYSADQNAKIADKAADKQADMAQEQADQQVKLEGKSAKTQMEMEKLQMAHEKQQMDHAQKKHVIDGEKMERQASMSQKKKVMKKALDTEGNLVDTGEVEEIDEVDWEGFTNQIQKSIHSGELKSIMENLREQV
jgi:Phage portal protein